MDQTNPRVPRRLLTRLALLVLTASMSFGCSPDLASIDDHYVPQSVDENFPIKVVERPVKLTFTAAASGISPADRSRLDDFARQAAAVASTPVTVGYPSGSKLARQAAGEAAAILAGEGVRRANILVTPREGRVNEVTLAFATKIAETKPCGDFSESLRANQQNDTGPNFGCTFQQNFAAMIANPGDLLAPQPADPAPSAAQKASLDKYYDGTWQTPTTDNTLSTSSGN